LLAGSVRVAIVVPPDERGREFATQLAGELDEPAAVHTSTLTIEALVSLPPLPWREPFVLFADPERARIAVIRSEDRTLLLRALDESSPYALAVAGAELLDAAEAEPVRSRLSLGGSVSIGVGVVEAFGHEPVLVSGSIAAELELREGDLWSTIGLGFEATSSAEVSNVRYRRWEPSLRLGLGRAIGDLDLGATLAAGVSVARAEAFDVEGVRIGADDRVPVLFALGGRARYRVGAGFCLGAEASLGWSVSPADYVVKDVLVLSEGRFRWGVSAVAGWVFSDR
jgi:hypothetical protein